jgi:hypothetical protein
MADTGTIIGGILGGVAVLIIGIVIGKRRSDEPFVTPGVPVFLKIFHYFLPYSLIFYALLNDLIFETGMYSPAVAIGFVFVLLNGFVSKNREVNIGKIQTDLCTIPGFSGLPAYEFPQITVFVSIVLGYISMFNTTIQTAKGSDWTKIIPPWILLISFGLIQYFTMLKDNCFDNFNIILGSSFVNWLITFLVSAGIGILSGWGISQSTTFAEASSGSPSFTSVGPPSSTKPPMAKSSDPNIGTCSAPNDQDQFVCEAYKNGELVTSTVVENFIGK